MRQMEPIAAYVPYMVIAGNHEDDGKNFSHYVNRFTMPNSPFKDNQVYRYVDLFVNLLKIYLECISFFSFSFDLGPVHFVAVSTEYYGFFYEYGTGSIFAQHNWLEQDLKVNKCSLSLLQKLREIQKADANRAKTPWIVSFQHRPFYCSNENSEECASFENRMVSRAGERSEEGQQN